MALLTTGEWYSVTWSQTSAAAWSSLTPPRPQIPWTLVDNLVDANPMVIYVTDSATGSFVFQGGVAAGWDDSLINTSSAALTKNTWTDDNGGMYQYAVDGSGIVWYYDTINQSLQSFSAPEA